MITSSNEYYKNLLDIQNAHKNRAPETFRLPEGTPVNKIDLNRRTIKAPDYLSVAKDHHAETIYFECNRYFDNVDLTHTTGVVQYINANNEGGIYLIPFYDIESKEGKIIFPWCIAGQATATSGIVKFSVRFYVIEPQISQDNKILGYRYIYNLNTMPAQSKVLYGLDISEEVLEKYHIDTNILDEINTRLKYYGDHSELCWLKLGETDFDAEEKSDYEIIDKILGQYTTNTEESK